MKAPLVTYIQDGSFAMLEDTNYEGEEMSNLEIS
jgi:hypothetical protein